MDISLSNLDTKFDYRVRAIFIKNNKLLLINDKGPYYYLPGGRCKVFESSKEALIREIKEEIGLDCEIIKTLYVHEQFFNNTYHEICTYFLVDIKDIEDKDFVTYEDGKENKFYFINLEDLDKLNVYPEIIIDKIIKHDFNLDILM